MSNERRYPRRLIEVDLPIKEISAHARREKYVGTISSLHLWWARRPLAACRAVVCGALWLDPDDSLCPGEFRVETRRVLQQFARQVAGSSRLRDLCTAGIRRWMTYAAADSLQTDPAQGSSLREDLLAFLSDFSNLNAAGEPAFVDAARSLTSASSRAASARSDAPFGFDPFAGGGAIPVELQRSGANTFASDLNPVALLLNRVLVEYWPRYGEALQRSVQRWGDWVGKEAHRQLSDLYPSPADDELPIAYIWARTVTCEGPGCGIRVPLLRSLEFSRQEGKAVAATLRAPDGADEVDVSIGPRGKHDPRGTTAGAAMTCPRCGYTTPKARVRAQLVERQGGAGDARLIAVVSSSTSQPGRQYRLPVADDLAAVDLASERLATFERDASWAALLPSESIPQERVWKNNPIRVHLYGMTRWRDLFTPRQLVSLAVFSKLIRGVRSEVARDADAGLADATQTVLALAVSRMADHLNSACTWNPSGEKIQQLFKRQAVPMVWDFAEANPFGGSVGSWTSMVDNVLNGLSAAAPRATPGTTTIATATKLPLPDDIADVLITDPPYYDSVPYADLSDFFYVWLRRMLGGKSDLFASALTDKEEELVYNEARSKDRAFYEQGMCEAMRSARRVVRPDGVGVVVFAHKSTSGWESILSAMVNAGWVITASWPIDTELATRVRAMRSASLASSVHLVCRPRENPDGSLRTDAIGDWRSVLRELPVRIHEWMPRLASEGVVGADAIFACLGPALEIFSRYSRVEKASGEHVELREYLEQVWAAVAREALSMIFDDADATGLEEDARLTAMWLWTLSTSANGTNGGSTSGGGVEESEEGEKAGTGKTKPSAGFSLEFDAARKIAQGLGAHLEDLGRVVEIKGDQARLLSVAERTRHLFGTDHVQRTSSPRTKKPKQLTLFEELEAAEKDAGWGDVGLPPAGETALDRVHQSMVLFAAGRGEALKRFLVEDGIGRDARFWKLAQSLSALYPVGTEEKRWVDGVLTRKKGLGFG